MLTEEESKLKGYLSSKDAETFELGKVILQNKYSEISFGLAYWILNNLIQWNKEMSKYLVNKFEKEITETTTLTNINITYDGAIF